MRIQSQSKEKGGSNSEQKSGKEMNRTEDRKREKQFMKPKLPPQKGLCISDESPVR